MSTEEQKMEVEAVRTEEKVPTEESVEVPIEQSMDVEYTPKEKRHIAKLLKLISNSRLRGTMLQTVYRKANKLTAVDRPTKKRNAYLNFYSEQFKKRKALDSSQQLTAIANVLGKEWREMDEAAKAAYAI
jgi:hypothetical protein